MAFLAHFTAFGAGEATGVVRAPSSVGAKRAPGRVLARHMAQRRVKVVHARVARKPELLVTAQEYVARGLGFVSGQVPACDLGLVRVACKTLQFARSAP